MQIYLDSGNIEEIEKAVDIGISGVTTNPTSLSKEIKRTGLDFEFIISSIADMARGHASVETIKTDFNDIVRDAKNLSKLSDSIVVKIPLTYEGLKAIKILREEDIRTNATLIFSVNQALLAANAGADFVSIFLGRIEDTGYDGMNIIKDTVDIFDRYEFGTEIVAASIRSPLHVANAALAGANICTIPYNILEKMIEHPLTNIGIEKFMKDWKIVM